MILSFFIEEKTIKKFGICNVVNAARCRVEHTVLPTFIIKRRLYDFKNSCPVRRIKNS